MPIDIPPSVQLNLYILQFAYRLASQLFFPGKIDCITELEQMIVVYICGKMSCLWLLWKCLKQS